MAVQYTHLTYESFKKLEQQMKEFKETTHRTEGGFYHKSIRLVIDGGLIMEFHGPLVGGYGHAEGPETVRGLEDKTGDSVRSADVQHGRSHLWALGSYRERPDAGSVVDNPSDHDDDAGFIRGER